MRALRAVSVFTFMVLVSQGAFAQGVTNDAGTGSDAGGDAATAIALDAWGGPWNGTLRRDDIDAYRLPAPSAPACVEASFSSDGRGVLELSTPTAATQLPFDASAVQLSLATMPGTAPLLTVTGTQSSNGLTNYRFSTARIAATSSTPDAGTGTGAQRVTGGCAVGNVGGLDLSDEFLFLLPPGDALVLSAATASEAMSFELLSASDQSLATLAPGEVLTLTGLPAGEYRYRASSSSFSSEAYALSLAIGPPGCKPNC